MDLTIAMGNVSSLRPECNWVQWEADLKETFELICKDYVFQLETGAKSRTDHFSMPRFLKKEM